MYEFKVTKEFSGEISEIKKTVKVLNENYKAISSNDVNTLKTSVAYIDQHIKIKKLVDLYRGFVLKDTKELLDMVKKVEQMDQDLSGKK